MEIKPGSLYKVTVTEYEANWGQRTDPNDTKFFTSLAEAKAYQKHWEEGGTPEYYWRASIEKVN